MHVDVKKIALSSAVIIATGVVLVVLSLILQLLSLLINDSNGSIIDTVNAVYSIVLLPVFCGLYFWAGMRAVKKYGMDSVGAGLVAAFSYFVIASVRLLLNLILTFVVVSRLVDGSGFGSTESVVAASIFGGTAGLSGVGLSAVCGIGIILFGTMVNFVVGGSGGLFALRR